MTMKHKSSQVAIGGMASGLCLLLMFLTGMIPFSEYACPTFAGLVLIAVAEEPAAGPQQGGRHPLSLLLRLLSSAAHHPGAARGGKAPPPCGKAPAL